MARVDYGKSRLWQELFVTRVVCRLYHDLIDQDMCTKKDRRSKRAIGSIYILVCIAFFWFVLHDLPGILTCYVSGV